MPQRSLDSFLRLLTWLSSLDWIWNPLDWSTTLLDWNNHILDRILSLYFRNRLFNIMNAVEEADEFIPRPRN